MAVAVVAERAADPRSALGLLGATAPGLPAGRIRPARRRRRRMRPFAVLLRAASVRDTPRAVRRRRRVATVTH